MPVAPLLKRFVDDELARASLLGEQACAGGSRTCRSPRAASCRPTRVQARREAAAALQERAAEFAAAFAAPSSVVRAALEEPSAHAPHTTSGQTGGLSLMDESLVEADIEISRATMQIDSLVEWEQRELQTFTSALRGEAHVGESSNPIRPCAHRARPVAGERGARRLAGGPGPGPARDGRRDRRAAQARVRRRLHPARGPRGSRPASTGRWSHRPEVRSTRRPSRVRHVTVHCTPCSRSSHRSPRAQPRRRRIRSARFATVGPEVAARSAQAARAARARDGARRRGRRSLARIRRSRHAGRRPEARRTDRAACTTPCSPTPISPARHAARSRGCRHRRCASRCAT